MNTFACFFVALISVLAAEVRADCAGASQADPLYRAYSDGASDHFYTTDLAEYNSAVAGGGYTAEGVRLLVFTTQVAGSVQFIRLWNGDKSDHFYTTNATEAKSAVTGGYVIEDKTPMYIYPTQICGSVPLYRSYSQTGTDHFYTIDAAERDGAVGSGWAYEWIAGYVFPPSSGSSGTTTKTTTTATTATATTTTTTGKTTTTTAAAPSPTASAPSPSTSNSSASSTTDDGLTAPVLPAPTTVLGGSFADTLPTTSATPGTSAAIRMHLPRLPVVGLVALLAVALCS